MTEVLWQVWNPDNSIACDVTFISDQPCGAGEGRQRAGCRGDEFDVLWNLQKDVSERDSLEGRRARTSHKLDVDFIRAGVYGRRDLSKPRRGIVSEIHNDGLNVFSHGMIWVLSAVGG